METNYFPPVQIYVSSDDAQPITLPVPLIIPSAYSVYLSLVEAQLPVASYNCIGDLIQFSIVGGLVSTYTINIPDGCYSQFELAELITHTTPSILSSARIMFGAEYIPSANKFQFIVRCPAQLSDIRLLTTPLAVKMGFVGTDLPASSSRTRGAGLDPVSVWISQRQSTFASISNFYVGTSLLLRHSSGRTNCIAKIPIEVGFNEVVRWQNPNNFAAQLYVNEVTSFSVSVTDDKGAVVDFQGVPWSLTLQFDVKNPDANPVIPDEQNFEPVVEPDTLANPANLIDGTFQLTGEPEAKKKLGQE